MLNTNDLPDGIIELVTNAAVFANRILLADALEIGERRMRVAGLRATTADEYLDEGRAFVAWFRATYGRAPGLADLVTREADRYIIASLARADERGTPWSEGTRDHHIRQLRALAGHLAGANDLPGNPLKGMTTKADRHESRRSIRKGDGLDDDAMRAIVGALDPRGPVDLVTRGIILLGYEGGPRTSESPRLQVEDVREVCVAGRVLGTVVTIQDPAKDGPQRILPLGVRATEVLREVIGNRTSGFLFPNRSGRQLTVKTVRDRLMRAGGKVGVDLCPQRLRKSAATWQATYGASEGHLDTVFGWEPTPLDFKSRSYIVPRPEQLLYAHQARLSPLDRLEARLAAAGEPPLL
jgi:site-specific recombinase XerC